MLGCSPTPQKQQEAGTHRCVLEHKVILPLALCMLAVGSSSPTGDTQRVLGNRGKGKTPSLCPHPLRGDGGAMESWGHP